MKNKLLSLVAMTILSLELSAAPIKVGVLAPEGTGWAKAIKKMAQEIKAATKDQVEFKVYFGGSQGDEQDVLRKIRVGQLQGGIFTGKTLGDISGDVRAIEIPFTFNHDRNKALKTLQAMSPYFSAQIAKNKFQTLSMFEIGQVYLVSQKKVDSMSALKGIKIWSWEGDTLVTNMIDAMKFVSVPLALPDVLASLTTGIVEAAYAPPVGILALQWNSKIKYIIDFPVTFSVGAFVVSSQAWSKISPANQKLIMDISKKYETEINAQNAKDNADALMAMKAQKIEFIKFPDAEVKVAQSYRAEIINRLKGKLFSAEALSKLDAELKK